MDHHDLRAEDDLPYQGHKVQVQDQVLVRVLVHTYLVEDSLDPGVVVVLYRNSFPGAVAGHSLAHIHHRIDHIHNYCTRLHKTHIVAAVVVVLVAHNQVPVPVPVLPVLLLLFEVQSLGKDVVQDIHHRYTPSFLFMLVLKCMRSRFL